MAKTCRKYVTGGGRSGMSGDAMTVLALNAGSSSLKFGLVNVSETGSETLLSGEEERVGDPQRAMTRIAAGLTANHGRRKRFVNRHEYGPYADRRRDHEYALRRPRPRRTGVRGARAGLHCGATGGPDRCALRPARDFGRQRRRASVARRRCVGVAHECAFTSCDRAVLLFGAQADRGDDGGARRTGSAGVHRRHR